jgi:hypothetical protein
VKVSVASRVRRSPFVVIPTSEGTMALKAGVPLDPAGAMKAKCCVAEAHTPVRVPVVVTGDPETVNSAGRLSPTLVTVPDPEEQEAHVGVAVPF